MTMHHTRSEAMCQDFYNQLLLCGFKYCAGFHEPLTHVRESVSPPLEHQNAYARMFFKDYSSIGI